MDDFDAGFKKGRHDLNRIVALKEDLAYEQGLLAGYNLCEGLQRSLVPEKNVHIKDCIIDRRLQWEILEQAMELIAEKIEPNNNE